MFYFIIAVIFAIYYYMTRNHDYWKKRNVKHDPPIPFFGNHFKNITSMKNYNEISTELYNKYPDEKVVGYYRGVSPELIIKDLDIVRDILSVDFSYFHRRGLGRNPKREPLLRNLFHAEGDMWKLLRQRLTPAFTTAKLKNMFPLIIECAEKLQVVGEDIVAHGGECDARDLMARFTTEFIGACGFGIDMNSINDGNSMFRQLGKEIFKVSVRDVALVFLSELFPELKNMIAIANPKVENMIKEMVQTVCEQRQYKSSARNDFIDLLLELQGKGIIEGQSLEKTNADGTPEIAKLQIDLEVMMAQAFVFFAAGFETTSSATSYNLYQLALNPDIQKKVQDEIDEVLSKYNNKLCYDAIAELQFLNMAFKESLRMFPSVFVLNRECVKQYTISKLGIVIDPGVKISIPVQAIHMDPQHFDNPTEYRPERFMNDKEHLRHKYSYLPFGEGPRSCIGSRLGHMQSLAGLAAVLQKFTVEPSSMTPRELKLDPRHNVIQVVEGGIPLKLKLRKSDTRH